jgi:hypothetical protein
VECWTLSEKCVGIYGMCTKSERASGIYTAMEFLSTFKDGMVLESRFIPDCAKSTPNYIYITSSILYGHCENQACLS